MSELKKQNIIIMILLTIITLGIYPYFWLHARSRVFSALESEAKLKISGKFTLSLILASLVGVAATLLEPILPGTKDQYSLAFAASIIDQAATWYALIGLIFVTFKSCTILERHFHAATQEPHKFSRIIAFFLTVFYLQYKINRFTDRPNAA